MQSNKQMAFSRLNHSMYYDNAWNKTSPTGFNTLFKRLLATAQTKKSKASSISSAYVKKIAELSYLTAKTSGSENIS